MTRSRPGPATTGSQATRAPRESVIHRPGPPLSIGGHSRMPSGGRVMPVTNPPIALGWPPWTRLDNRQSGVAEVLAGRSGELALIGAFVERARTGGEALLLFGEPGVGKTVLLDAAADAASEAGTWVLRAAGVEFEADLTFSGLHQALLPLFDEFGQLSITHREALNVALGYGEGPPPDRLLVFHRDTDVAAPGRRRQPGARDRR